MVLINRSTTIAPRPAPLPTPPRWPVDLVTQPHRLLLVWCNAQGGEIAQLELYRGQIDPAVVPQEAATIDVAAGLNGLALQIETPPGAAEMFYRVEVLPAAALAGAAELHHADGTPAGMRFLVWDAAHMQHGAPGPYTPPAPAEGSAPDAE